MPIVQAKCENCGGVLAVDDSQKAAVCPFCNTPYVVQDAINNYNITNNINVGAGAIVNVYGDKNNDFEIEAGVLKRYKGSAIDVIIPNSAVEIGEYAFKDLAITRVTIPDSVNSIGFSAFAGCKSLKNITIPDSVTSIGNAAFEHCTSLESVTIPDSVTRIGDYAFHNTAYYNDDSNWEDGVLYIGNYLIKANTYALIVDIKKGIKKIADYAFSRCTSLESVTISDSVTNIGNSAFERCTSLESVTIPSSVISIGDSAFAGCTSLESITIPDGVTSIGEFAFSYCTSLKNATISNSVTSIGNNAFSDCPKVTFNCSSTVKSLIDNSVESTTPKSSGGCYVATAVYGSYDCPQVWTLRRYRDYKLDATWYGRLFIMLYYAISPTLVKWFGDTNWFKKLWRGKLDRMVERLQNEGYEDTPYNDKY